MTKNDGKIFIQCASFIDPELPRTIESCLEHADEPDKLVFSICWQRDRNESDEPYRSADEEVMEKYVDDDRFKFIDVSHVDAKGACWARNLLQQQYDGEQWTLQIDSHMRFAPHWDTICKNMVADLQNLGFEKPLLTAYVPSYDPNNDPAGRVMEPWKLDFDRFTPEGVIFMLPASFEPSELDHPLPSRFYSAHFAFATGDFVLEVPHDPDYYFHGEEISIAVRAYTHGYDLFNPNTIICWHEYTRKNRVGKKCWDVGSAWIEHNERSLCKNRQLFGMDNEPITYDFVGTPYGFGYKRTLEDYESFSGINFKLRGVQDYTLQHLPPPNPHILNDNLRLRSFRRIYRHCIDLYSQSVALDDYEFWAVVFKDANGEDLFREDATPDEIRGMRAKATADGNSFLNLWRQFERIDDRMPASWVVWPYSTSKGWLDPISGTLFHGRHLHI